MNANPQETDVFIIGAGPVGLFAVFACGMLGLKTHVIDSLSDLGGQCTALYPDKPIYDIPGFTAITGADLITRLESQAAPFAPVYHLNQTLVTLTQENALFAATTNTGTQIHARAVIIAGGAGVFGPNRPPIDGLAAFEGKSVFYAVRNPQQFAGKHIVIAGGGDSAIDWANILGTIAAKVYLVHRRDTFRAAPASLTALEAHIAADRIQKMTPYQLKNIAGKNGQIDTVTIADMDDRIEVLSADALLCFYGLATSLGPIADFGLGLDAHHIVVDPTTCATNRPGIYAVGDIATYPHKQRLILTGFAEATGAAHAAYHHIYPDAVMAHVHSTTKGIPGIKGDRT